MPPMLIMPWLSNYIHTPTHKDWTFCVTIILCLANWQVWRKVTVKLYKLIYDLSWPYYCSSYESNERKYANNNHSANHFTACTLKKDSYCYIFIKNAVSAVISYGKEKITFVWLCWFLMTQLIVPSRSHENPRNCRKRWSITFLE